MQIGGTYTIDFARVSKIPKFEVTIKNGDIKRTIKLILLKNSEVLNLNNYTVVVAAKKTDGKDIFNDIKIIDAESGICEVEITEQMLALGMDLPCEIVLYNSDGVVASSSNFVISKISSLKNEETIVSSSEFTALTKALSDVTAIQVNINNKRDKSTAIEMKDLSTEVKENMTGGSVAVVGKDAVGIENIKNYSVSKEKTTFYTDLESIVNDVNIQEMKLTIDTHSGFITSSNHANGAGNIISHVAYIYTDMFALKKGSLLKINASTSSNVCVLSMCNKDGTFLKELIIGDDRKNYYEYTVESEVEYLRVCNNTSYVNSNVFQLSVKSSNSNLFENTVNEIYTQIDNSIENIFTYKNLDLKFNNGFITSSNHTNGAGNILNASNYIYSDLFEFKKGSLLKINASTSSNVCVLSRWSKDGTFLKELIIGDDKTNYYEYTVESDVEYLRVCNNTSYLGVCKVEGPSNALNEINKINEDISTINNKFNKFDIILNPQSLRVPVICFIFDDGLTSDINVYNLFKKYNLTCGFALLSSNTRISEYLEYQKEGFEILSHSTDGNSMESGTDPIELIENKFKTSKQMLENNGFYITSWVTPSSQLNSKYLDSLKKYYELAYTNYLGTWDESLNKSPYNTFNEDTRGLHRVSMQSNELQNILLAIDRTIENNGFLSFYAHSYPDTTLPIEKLTAILDYVKSKVDNSECLVMTPRNCYKHYYSLRHSDFLSFKL